MRVTAFRSAGEIGLATRRDGRLLRQRATHPRYPGPLDQLIAQGLSALRRAESDLATDEAFDGDSILFLPPLPHPGKIICVGLDYRDHSKEGGYAQPDYPTLFARFTSSLIGHGTPMVTPTFSNSLDFEGELVAVIGIGGRFIPKGSAPC